MKRIDIPPQVINCKNWLLKDKRFKDYDTISLIIRRAENSQNIDGTLSYWLKSILEEYCHAHDLTPTYKIKENVSGFYEDNKFTVDAEELFRKLFEEDAKKRRRR